MLTLRTLAFEDLSVGMSDFSVPHNGAGNRRSTKTIEK